MNLLLLLLNTEIKAIPLPYIPSYDNTIAIIVLSCFLLSCFLIATSKQFLLELVANFKQNKDHISAFLTKTNSEVISLMLLLLQTCILTGVIVFILAVTMDAAIVEDYSSTTIIFTTTSICIVYLLIKWIIYSFIGWTFNKRHLTSIWTESYATIIYYLGFILYPIVLYIIFSTVPIYITVYITIILIVVIKSLMLYKWMKLFSNNIYGRIQLFLYFCALEIIPCILIYKCITKYINILTINI